MIDTNVKGVLKLIKAIVPDMIKRNKGTLKFQFARYPRTLNTFV